MEIASSHCRSSAHGLSCALSQQNTSTYCPMKYHSKTPLPSQWTTWSPTSLCSSCCRCVPASRWCCTQLAVVWWVKARNSIYVIASAELFLAPKLSPARFQSAFAHLNLWPFKETKSNGKWQKHERLRADENRMPWSVFLQERSTWELDLSCDFHVLGLSLELLRCCAKRVSPTPDKSFDKYSPYIKLQWTLFMFTLAVVLLFSLCDERVE